MEKVRPEDRLILNADFNNFNDLRHLSQDLKGLFYAVKLGMAFLSNEKAGAIHRHLLKAETRTFGDFKFEEDPDQMPFVYNQHQEQGYSFLSVAANVKPRALANARQTADSSRLVVLLSSSDTEYFTPDLNNIQRANDLLAEESDNRQIDLVMCKAVDVQRVRDVGNFTTIATGVRLEGQVSDDHESVCTPADALRAKADFIAMGRPILQSRDQVARVHEVLENMKEAA